VESTAVVGVVVKERAVAVEKDLSVQLAAGD